MVVAGFEVRTDCIARHAGSALLWSIGTGGPQDVEEYVYHSVDPQFPRSLDEECSALSPTSTSHCVFDLISGQSARKSALQVIAEYEGTPAGAVEVPDLSALRELYSEKNPAVPSLRYLTALV